MLTDVVFIEVAAGVGVVEKLIFGEDTPLGREVVVHTRARLKGEAAVIVPTQVVIYAINVDIDIVASLAPPATDTAEDIRLEAAAAVRCITKDGVRHESRGVEKSIRTPDLDAVDIHMPGEIDAIVEVIFFQPPAESSLAKGVAELDPAVAADVMVRSRRYSVTVDDSEIVVSI